MKDISEIEIEKWKIIQDHQYLLNTPRVIAHHLYFFLENDQEIPSNFFISYIQDCILYMEKLSSMLIEMKQYPKMCQKVMQILNLITRVYKLLQLFAQIAILSCHIIEMKDILICLYKFDSSSLSFLSICRLCYYHIIDLLVQDEQDTLICDIKDLPINLALNYLNSILKKLFDMIGGSEFIITNEHLVIGSEKTRIVDVKKKLENIANDFNFCSKYVKILANDNITFEANNIAKILNLLLNTLMATEIKFKTQNRNFEYFNIMDENFNKSINQTFKGIKNVVKNENNEEKSKYFDIIDEYEQIIDKIKENIKTDTKNFKLADFQYEKLLVKVTNFDKTIKSSNYQTKLNSIPLHLKIINILMMLIEGFDSENFGNFFITQIKPSFYHNLTSTFHIHLHITYQLMTDSKIWENYQKNLEDKIFVHLELPKCFEILNNFIIVASKLLAVSNLKIQLFDQKFHNEIKEILLILGNFSKIKETLFNTEIILSNAYCGSFEFFTKFIEALIIMEDINLLNLKELNQHLEIVNQAPNIEARILDLLDKLKNDGYPVTEPKKLRDDIEQIKQYFMDLDNSSQNYFIKDFHKMKLFKGITGFNQINLSQLVQWHKAIDNTLHMIYKRKIPLNQLAQPQQYFFQEFMKYVNLYTV